MNGLLDGEGDSAAVDPSTSASPVRGTRADQLGSWRTLYKPNNGSPADDALGEAIFALSAEIGDLEAWNDAPDRGQEDVLDVFDRLIERAGQAA